MEEGLESVKEHAMEIRNLSVTLGGVPILSGVNADMTCGEVTALIGPNGAGKTTLLSAILGLVPYKGEIRFCPCLEHGGGRPTVNYVPQQLDFDRRAPLTVMEFLSLTVQRRPLWFGAGKKTREVALFNLERVNAGHLALRPLGKLSGGEFQRVMLALALSPKPDILLLDEPVAGVDAAGEELFCELLDKLRQEAGFSLLLVSHDLQIVSRHADHVICLNQSVLCQGRAVEILTPANIKAVFGLHAGLYSHDEAGHVHHT
jgi:zinc transport system ATP-binding protein